MKSPLKLLVVDDAEADYRRVLDGLRAGGMAVEGRRIWSHDQLIDALGEGNWDAVLSDYPLPGVDFLTCIQYIAAQDPDLPMIVVSGSVGEEQAVELLKQGVWDFVLKSSPSRLLPAIRRTLREAAERRARRESEALASLIFDTVPEAMLVVDAGGAIVRANLGAERMFGYTRQELLQLPVERLIPEPHRASHRGVRAAFCANPAPRPMGQDLALVAVSRDGREFPVEISLGPLELGGQIHVVATVIDITEIREAQRALGAYRQHLEELVSTRAEALRQQTRYLRTLIDGFPFEVWLKDTEGRYLAANRLAAAAVGVDVRQMVDRTDAELLPREQAERYRGDDREVMASCRRKTVEVRIGEGAQARWIETYKAPVVDDDGSVLGTVGYARDISERKTLEAVREAALAQAERLARMRSEFLANMSHEIRTPLNAILGLAQIGRRETLGRRVHDTFSRILDSGRHLLAIVNDVLDFSKIEANKLELEEAPYRLAEVIDRAVELTAETAFAKGLAFTVEEAPDLPQQCVGDGLRVLQILVNILSNAVKFTEAGSVGLRVGRDRERLRFEVVDTGIGMSGDQIDRLFQPFEQADGSTTRRFGGTGLGLAICRRLIDLIGGTIEVGSRPGGGSRFLISIPLRGADAAPAVAGGSMVLAGFEPGEASALRAQLSCWQVVAEIAEPAEALRRRCDLLVISQPALPAFFNVGLGQAAVRDQRIAVVAASAQFGTGLPGELSRRIRIFTRPLRVRQLIAAMQGQSGGGAAEAAVDQRLRGLAILAAEDNEINRLVLQDLLVLEGASVVLVETGAQAVEVLAARGADAFDLVLTDVQMPEMDGYETTRRIAGVAPGLPVIGLTAYALPEERARCLAAGMVEHVSKPIDPERLVAAILAHGRGGGRPTASGGTAATPPQAAAPLRAPVLDRAALELRYSGRNSLIGKLIRAGVASGREAEVKLRDAASAGDLSALRFVAHSVKGMAGNLEAKRCFEAAKALEAAAHDGSAEAPGLGRALAAELQRLQAELAAIDVPSEPEPRVPGEPKAPHPHG